MPKPKSLSSDEKRLLLAANVAMIGMIVIHDTDHVRQAINFCYTIGVQLWLVNVSVYVPSLVAIGMAYRSSTRAPFATAINGILVGAAFSEVHLWRPTIPVWGLWNDNFFILGVDWISWSILALTVLVGVLVAMVGAYVAGLHVARNFVNTERATV